MSVLMKSFWLVLGISAFLVHGSEGGVKDTQDRPLAPVPQEGYLTIDKEKKTVRIRGWITTLEQSNHCGIGWAGGSNGSASGQTRFLVETEVKPEEVFAALSAVGKRPGNNLSRWKRSTPVQGDPVTIKVQWPGSVRQYDLADLVQDDKGASLEFRFGGNLQAAKTHHTGCISCFTSCYVAIVSNARVVLRERKNHRFRFTHLAPPPGTEVELIFF
jgi:hypothetical protein